MISVLRTISIFFWSQSLGRWPFKASISPGWVRNSPAATVPPRAMPAAMMASLPVLASRKRATMA